MRGWLASALALGLFLVATRAAIAAPAPGGDYEPIDGPWNGVGYLVTTGAEARVDVEVVTDLDLDALRPDDVILWLYPRAPLPVDALLAFVDDGGRLIVADDHGGADALFAAVGITRRSAGPSAHRRWFEGVDGLPVLTASDEHFLFFNVEELVANHPAALLGEGRPLVSFDDIAGDGPTEHLVIERAVGRGVLLAIADPSIFLNQMLRRFYGNKQFAANVMRLYCRAEPCRIKLLLPPTETSGRYTSGHGRLGSLPRLVERGATALNDTLAALSALLATPPFSGFLALLVVLVSALLVALGLAAWRAQATAPLMRLGVPPRSPLVAEARGLSSARGDADFFDLALALSERAERLLSARGLERWATGHEPPPLGETEESLHCLQRAALRVRQDTDSLRSKQRPVISAERFVRLSDDVQTLSRFASSQRGRRRGGVIA